MHTALYRLHAADNALLYVGITVNPSSRWHTHRADHAWWPEVAEKVVVWFDSRIEAAQAEAAAIRAEHPLHNRALPDEDGLGGWKLRATRRTSTASPRKTSTASSGTCRQFRMGGIWDAFGEAIEQAEPELDRSKVIREFVRWYIGETNSLPRRPRRADDGNEEAQR